MLADGVYPAARKAPDSIESTSSFTPEADSLVVTAAARASLPSGAHSETATLSVPRVVCIWTRQVAGEEKDERKRRSAPEIA
jgi:hypothetical protein